MDRQDRETRRAENQVWNGWGDYARKPELLTFDRAGDAELYGNTVLGLACRYYDFDRFRPLLNEFHRSAQEALYTDVFFLVLEGAVFARGAAERPLLPALRRDYARRLLAQTPVAEGMNGDAVRRAWACRVLEQPEDPALSPLLDGSASQNRQQEKLATQAYLIAESLSRCRIPVRVTAFCSVSGCTVLRVLRDYDHPEQNEGVFDYVAAGWNRDGLALRAMGWLLRQRRSEQSLLLVLSDASPNDDQRIPNGLGGWAYTGKRGVDDTAAEAAALRLQGVLPVCLFTGSDREVPDARRIYGQAMERLPAIGWLADAVTRLIRGQLRRE